MTHYDDDVPDEVLAEIVSTHESGHSITWIHPPGRSGVMPVVICHEPVDAPCHRCDEFCAHGPEVGQHEECLLVESLISCGIEPMYIGTDVRVRDARIELTFDESGDVLWWYEGSGRQRFEDDQELPAPLPVVDLPDISAVDDKLSVAGETVTA